MFIGSYWSAVKSYMTSFLKMPFLIVAAQPGCQSANARFWLPVVNAGESVSDWVRLFSRCLPRSVVCH